MLLSVSHLLLQRYTALRGEKTRGEERRGRIRSGEKKKQQTGGAEKSGVAGIEQDGSISSSKLQQAAARKRLREGEQEEEEEEEEDEGGKKKRSPELCRFVSEGEKSAARSNRPLIFPSCIKGSALWGGRAGEAALLIFVVCLAPRLRWHIHTYVRRCRLCSAARRHKAAILRAFHRAFHRNYSVLFP